MTYLIHEVGRRNRGFAAQTLSLQNSYSKLPIGSMCSALPLGVCLTISLQFSLFCVSLAHQLFLCYCFKMLVSLLPPQIHLCSMSDLCRPTKK